MGSTKDEAKADKQPLDLKPLVSLLPMFPTSPGYDVSSQSSDPPLASLYHTYIQVLLLIRRSYTSSTSTARIPQVSTIPLKATPISAKFPTPKHKDESLEEEYHPFCKKRKPPSLKRTTKKSRQAPMQLTSSRDP